MKLISVYRAARRNLARITLVTVATPTGRLRSRTSLRLWRMATWADEANLKAKLALRAKQCEGARKAVINFIFGQPGTKIASRAINGVLHAYWSGVKPRTRVISRILREVAPVTLAAA